LNHENLGFAAGCNPGIGKALEDGCQYILLLNNDCLVNDVQFLDKAVNFAEATPDCGVVGGKILCWPETTRIWSTGGYITRFSREAYIGQGEVDKGQYEQVAERSFVSGALMLIKREVIARIGMLPDVYFFGKEDWEYSARVIQAGFRIFYNPHVTIYHRGSHSHAPTDSTYVYNGTLSKILYTKRQHSRLFFLIWISMYWFYLKVLFFAKFCLRQATYLQGVNPVAMRRTMLQAVRDSSRIPVITREVLEKFRRSHSQPGIHEQS
jgi:GT2 family glycosyltransferase